MKYTPHKKVKHISGLKSSLPIAALFLMKMAYANPLHIKIIIEPNQSGVITSIIQKAIDSCGANGGGVVFFPAGNFNTGGIQLQSKVTLLTEKGTIIYGSDQYADYKNDAFIFGENLNDIAILGEGIIDGVDCKNTEGEEGFRGPHCIRLINCRNISIKGITIKNSANWAINCRLCMNATVQNVSIRGGHDGLHTRFCTNFNVSGCDFRTGDDAFAGNDNKDFIITDCKVNTSCNGFRMGCYNFTVKRCKLYGPGEYIHKSQNRSNMLAAFVHFSPADENPKLMSGNWLIEDITVENVEHFYRYNFQDGLWQTGQPATNIQFKNVKATNLLTAFNIVGDTGRLFNLSIRNSSFSFKEGATYSADLFEGVKIQSAEFFYASNFNQIKLQKVAFQKKNTPVLLKCRFGNLLLLNLTKLTTGKSVVSYSITDVNKVTKDGTLLNLSSKTNTTVKQHL